MFNNWIKTEPSPVTWKQFMEALKECELVKVCKEVKKYLDSTEAHEKYSQRPDYTP